MIKDRDVRDNTIHIVMSYKQYINLVTAIDTIEHLANFYHDFYIAFAPIKIDKDSDFLQFKQLIQILQEIK